MVIGEPTRRFLGSHPGALSPLALQHPQLSDNTRGYQHLQDSNLAYRARAMPNFAITEFYEVRSWKGPGYSHRPNTTNATPTTTAVTTVASNVATNTKGILASLGQLFEGV